MLIDDDEERCIWDKVYKTLKFNPSMKNQKIHSITGELPFQIDVPYSVYAIEHPIEQQIDLMDSQIRNSLIQCRKKQWYALDWQHSSFKFHPENIEEQQSFFVQDNRYLNGGYYAYFPSFYPDGDYYFFIDEDFENGYLGHPWRKEVWVFGVQLQNEIRKIYQDLGWELIYSTCESFQKTV